MDDIDGDNEDADADITNTYKTFTNLMEEIITQQSLLTKQMQIFKKDLDNIVNTMELYMIQDKQNTKQLLDMRVIIAQNTKDSLVAFKKEIKELINLQPDNKIVQQIKQINNATDLDTLKKQQIAFLNTLL